MTTVAISLPTKNAAQEELRAWSEVEDGLIDVGAAALAFARLRNPGRDFKVYRNHLDQIAAEVGTIAATVKPQRVEQVAGILKEIIAVRHGYKGDAQTYDALENADLMRVIDRRRGLSWGWRATKARCAA